MKPLKLITALGNTDLVLELIDFFNGEDQFHYKEEVNVIRSRFVGRRLSSLHLVCTKGMLPRLDKLRCSITTDYPNLAGHIEAITLDCDDVICRGDDREVRDKVYGEVERLALTNDLIISSGGRKTITQRLIEAGLLYGCLGYLTLTAEHNERREDSMNFNVLWTSARRFAEERRPGLIKSEMGDNFRSLYLLPSAMIRRLQEEHIGVDPASEAADLAWLQRLPKADLHCHLGGAYDATLLKAMASSLLADLSIDQRRIAMITSHYERKLAKPLATLSANDLRHLRLKKDGRPIIHCLQNLDCLFTGLSEPRHLCTAVLVAALTARQIESISHDGRTPDDWPANLEPHDILTWYMACGDLGGSNLLQTERSLRQSLTWLLEASTAENIRLLEVRFSPDNYTREGLTIREVIDILLDEARRFMATNTMQVNFLIMATRHRERASMIAHVAAAVTFSQTANTGEHEPRLVGFDLAGQEEGNDPALFQDLFMPLHHHFINITIHAGEMAESDKIWQALYLLHAKRIGHGLKLINNAKMMGYVRDYGISIEMCPSSNRQTNSFRTFLPTSAEGDTYPLHTYLKDGLAVTINTDNRGISNTTLSKEYLQAAYLTPGGLSRWEVLRLVKNGIKAVFLPKNKKDELLKEIDGEVFQLALDDLFPDESPLR